MQRGGKYIVVIFGATGDLSQRMLYPALSRLLERDDLHIHVIGVSRGSRLKKEKQAAKKAQEAKTTSKENFQAMVAKSLKEHGPKIKKAHLDRFVKKMHFVEGAFDEKKNIYTSS